MDLNITMRYIMVQAQREADGGTVCVEHIYMLILSLFGKTAEEIARRPEHMEQVRADLDALHKLVTMNEIDVWPTHHLLKEALAGHFPQDKIPATDLDVPGLIARSEKRAGEKGQENITAFCVLTEIENKSTPLIKFCFIECGSGLTPREHAVARGMDIIRERLGLVPVPSSTADATVFDAFHAVAETVYHPDKEPEQVPEPKPEPEHTSKPDPVPKQEPKPEPAPAPERKPVQKEKPVCEPVPPANGVVFFDIPAPGAVAQGGMAAKPEPVKGGKQPKAKVPKIRTKIAGLTFRGRTVIAALQYFILVLAVPAAVMFGFARLVDMQVIKGAWVDTVLGVIVILWAMLILKGITSLLGRRFKPFEIFINTIINLGMGLAAVALIVEDFGFMEEPIWAKLLVIIFALTLIIVSMARLKRLQTLAGSSGHALSTAMLKLYGTPSSIFFAYMLRSSLIPIIVFAIVWVGNLQVNRFWHAAFSIYGFFLVYDSVRVLLQCWIIRYNKPNLHYKKKKWKKLSMFIMTEHLLLGLPELGLFIMWYFNWLPMPVWVIVLYCIYGLFWFLVTAGTLVTKVE